MSLKTLLEKYSKDLDLIDEIAYYLYWFLGIETAESLLTTDMSYIISIPHMTIEMVELIDKIKRAETEPEME